MILPHVFPTQDRHLALKISKKKFFAEWSACIQDKQRDLTVLLGYMEPVFAYWEQLLDQETFEIINIDLAILFRNLDGEGLDIEDLKNWVKRIKEESNLLSELRIIFLGLVKRFKYVPDAMKIEYAERHVITYFRYALSVDVKNSNAKRYQRLTGDNPDLVGKSDPEIDYIWLHNNDLTPWQKYLLQLYLQGYDTLAVEPVVHLPRETYYYESKKIWQNLQKNFPQR